jgi:hypothetical protein
VEVALRHISDCQYSFEIIKQRLTFATLTGQSVGGRSLSIKAKKSCIITLEEMKTDCLFNGYVSIRYTPLG